MDSKQIRQLLTRRFKDQKIEEPRPNVYRVSHEHSGTPVSIYYVDCSQSLLAPEFDLEEYQESLLADDYYQQEGDLQWNFYIYFLCDDNEYQKLLEHGRAGEIESNGLYARKYVTSQELFRRELDMRLEQWHRAVAQLPVDIGEEWSRKLEEHKLAGAYMPDVSCNLVFERYMHGQPISETHVETKQQSEADTTLSFITELHLGKYRPYPKQRKFEIGTCNLFDGVNGTGKTSLLEAIELWICGRTLRNYYTRERTANIQLAFKGTSLLKGRPANESRVYRERDLYWYGNHRSKGTELCYSFNRFNFYNTDAAISITSDSNVENINQALSRLVLGERANVIESRLKTLLNLFEPELRSSQKEFDRLQAQMEEASEGLRLLGSTAEDVGKYFTRFSENLKRLSWSGSLKNDELSLSNFLYEINELSAFAKECRSRLSWLPSVSSQSLSEAAARLSLLLDELKHISQKITESEKLLSEINDERKQLSARSSRLDFWELNYDRWFESKIIIDTEVKKEYTDKLKVLKEVNVYAYSDFDKSLGTFEAEQESREQALMRQSGELQKAVEGLGKRLGRMATLRAEIHAKSRQLIAADPGLEACPVCESHHAAGELARILTVQDEYLEIEQTGLLQRSLEKLDTVRHELTNVRAQLNDLAKLKQVCHVDTKLSDLPRILSEIPNQIRRINESLDEMTKSRARIYVEDAPLSPTVQAPTASSEVNQFGRIVLKDDDAERRQKYTSQKAELQQSLRDLEERERETERLLAAHKEERHSLLHVSGLDLESEEEWHTELKRRAEQLPVFIDAYANASAKLGAVSDETLSGLEMRLSQLHEAYEQYLHASRALEKTSRLRNQYLMKRQDAERSIPPVRQKKRLAERAVDVINDILERDKKEKYLEDFFRMNAQDLFDFFRLLHSPREFDSLRFDDENRKFMLVRKSGEESSLTQISSGQRAALSLAIFLALNRKLKKAPPFILFDDPVALIDDLNVLSFFDYLRNMITTGERQVFFATANQKVAELFRKKFSFLEDDFKDVRLDR